MMAARTNFGLPEEDRIAVIGRAGDAEQMVQLVATVLERPAPDVRSLRPEVPRELAAVVAGCLEKDPARRFRTYSEVRTALLPLSSLVPAPVTPARRYAAGAIDFCVLYLAMSLGGLIWLSLGGDPHAIRLGDEVRPLTAVWDGLECYAAYGERLEPNELARLATRCLDRAPDRVGLVDHEAIGDAWERAQRKVSIVALLLEQLTP